MIGIYKITNIINGNFYIGMSNNIHRRKMEHFTPKNILVSRTISKAIKKYGKENFNFEILEECKIEELCDKEIYYIKELKPIYNMNEGGNGNTGHHLSKELKTKLSEYGKKQWERKSEEEKKETIRKMKEPYCEGYWKGKKRSEETNQKIRETLLGREFPQRSEIAKLKAKETMRLKKLNGWKKDTTSHKKKVRCIELDIIFDSMQDAAKYFNVHGSCISGCVLGRYKTIKGYRFERIL